MHLPSLQACLTGILHLCKNIQSGHMPCSLRFRQTKERGKEVRPARFGRWGESYPGTSCRQIGRKNSKEPPASPSFSILIIPPPLKIGLLSHKKLKLYYLANFAAQVCYHQSIHTECSKEQTINWTFRYFNSIRNQFGPSIPPSHMEMMISWETSNKFFNTLLVVKFFQV